MSGRSSRRGPGGLEGGRARHGRRGVDDHTPLRPRGVYSWTSGPSTRYAVQVRRGGPGCVPRDAVVGRP